MQEVKRVKTNFDRFVAQKACTLPTCEQILDEVETWYPCIPRKDFYLELAERSCSGSRENWDRHAEIIHAIAENACLF